MKNIKCSVCGADPMESEDIYSDLHGECRHRHLNQCIGFLQSQIFNLQGALRLVLDQVDYTVGNCRVNEMVGGVLDAQIIKIAKETLK